jgi:hypothetical protein
MDISSEYLANVLADTMKRATEMSTEAQNQTYVEWKTRGLSETIGMMYGNMLFVKEQLEEMSKDQKKPWWQFWK